MFHDKLVALQQNRLSSGRLPSGAAPYTSSSSFKTGTQSSLPITKPYSHRLSLEAKNRGQSTLKASSNASNSATIISLGTARPAPQYYPWQSMRMQTAVCGDKSDVKATSTTGNSWMSCERGEDEYDLRLALNYGFAAGSPQLLRFITEHVELIHNPPYKDWETSLTCGSTSAIDILLRMLCNRGDCILSEAYTYTGIIEAVKPLGINIVGVEMDEEGLRADALESTLQEWDFAQGHKPTVLYTIPTGQNPTGATQSAERRHAIYRVVEKYNLTIIEDDPYYFLHVEESHASTLHGKDSTVLESYLESLPPSYLSLDISGRVLRLDTTSKILAPGLRCGWVTGCSQLIAKFLKHTEFSTSSPSGPSQVMLYKLLDESWGHDGFINWLIHLSAQYRTRLDTVVAACQHLLPLDICEWTSPRFGMFIWIEIDWRRHPSACRYIFGETQVPQLGIEDRIYTRARERAVQISKGSWFAAKHGLRPALYFRLTFVAAPEDELCEAVRRFGIALREEFFPGKTIRLGLDSVSCSQQLIAGGGDVICASN